MSERGVSQSVPTESEFMSWLRVKPRTYKWDALMAYDRVRVNRLLVENYIDQIWYGSVIGPITRLIPIVENSNWEYISDYSLSEPRISFQNSDINSSKATLNMNMIGGVSLMITKPANRPKQINEVNVVDAVQGNRLIGTISLGDSEGQVSDDGRVFINLRDALDLEVDIRDSAVARSLTGIVFQQMFEELDEDQQRYVFGELGPVGENDFLDPRRFMIRTYPAPETSVRGSPNYGDGAVMVFVAGKNSDEGAGPISTAGWIYPVPEGCSATLLIGNHFVVRRLLEEGLRNTGELVQAVADNQDYLDAPAGGLTITAGHRCQDVSAATTVGNIREFVMETTLPFTTRSDLGTAHFRIDAGGERFRLSWTGGSDDGSPGSYGVFTGKDSTGFQASGKFELSWSASRTYEVQVDERGELVAVEDESLRHHSCDTSVGPMDVMFNPAIDLIIAEIRKFGLTCIENTMVSVAEPLHEINLFRLHGLLLGRRYLRLKSAHYLHDMALLCDFYPRFTSFDMEPMEALVGPGRTLQFRTEPEMPGAQWGLKLVAGESPGTISASGLYTAPTEAEMPLHYGMVVVTAYNGDFIARGLVRIVKRPVVANPLVTMTGLGGAWTRFRAGSIEGGPVSWELRSTTGARLEEIPPPDADVEFEPGDRFYYSGPAVDDVGEEMIALDEILVTSSSGDTHVSSIVVVKDDAQQISIVKGSMTPNGVTLQMVGPEGPFEGGVQWSLLAGGGRVDENGKFSIDAASGHKYAVVVGKFRIPGWGWIGGYIILPIPLFDPDTIAGLLAD